MKTNPKVLLADVTVAKSAMRQSIQRLWEKMEGLELPTFNPNSFHNGTGYFNALVYEDQIFENNKVYTAVDEEGRRLYVVTQTGENIVAFLRYSDPLRFNIVIQGKCNAGTDPLLTLHYLHQIIEAVNRQ